MLHLYDVPGSVLMGLLAFLSLPQGALTSRGNAGFYHGAEGTASQPTPGAMSYPKESNP